MTMKCQGDKEAWGVWEEWEEVLVEEVEVEWTWDLWWIESTEDQDLIQCTEIEIMAVKDSCLEAMMTSSWDHKEEVAEEEVDPMICTIKEWDLTSLLKEDTMTTMKITITTTVVQCTLQEVDITRQDLTEEKECLLVEDQDSDLTLMEGRVNQTWEAEDLQWEEADVMTIQVMSQIIEVEEAEAVEVVEEEMMVLQATDLKACQTIWEAVWDQWEAEVVKMTETINHLSSTEELVEVVTQAEVEIEVVMEAIAIESIKPDIKTFVISIKKT